MFLILQNRKQLMAKNMIQSGDIVDMVALAPVVSGQVVMKGQMIAIALASVAAGEIFAAALCGAYEVPKASADTFTQGDVVYWDDTAKEMTSVPTDNKKAGYAWADAAGGETEMQVCLVPNV
jgi:predicted RecA/RadA family phage recombinase